MTAKQATAAIAFMSVVIAASGEVRAEVPSIPAVRTISMRESNDSVRQGAVVTAVRIQPRGTLLATAGDDHLVRLWDIRSGNLVGSLAGHADWVVAMDFSPDGKRLVTAGNDRQLILWDVARRRKLARLATHRHAIAQIEFSHAGSQIAVVGFDTNLSLLDAKNGRVLETFACPCRDMRSLAFSHDDQYLAAGGRNGVRVWELSTGEPLHPALALRMRVRAIQFTPSNDQLITAGEDGFVRGWSMSAGKPTFEFDAEHGKILSLVMHGNDHVITGGSDNRIRAWNLRTNRQVLQLAGHLGSIPTLDTNGRLLVSGSYDTTARIWNLSDSIPTRRVTASVAAELQNQFPHSSQ